MEQIKKKMAALKLDKDEAIERAEEAEAAKKLAEEKADEVGSIIHSFVLYLKLLTTFCFNCLSMS